jgi:hemerythrin-like domain-containing protein
MSRNELEQRLAERRAFLLGTSATAALGLCSCATKAARATSARNAHETDDHDEAEVTPCEDLMQEHGVLERVLLIYDEAARRIEGKVALDLSIVSGAAAIIRRFVEDYHEKDEEQFIFPRLERANREVALVAILKQQHARGRDATDEIMRRVAAGTSSPELASVLRAFERMYRPHAAREDTVLFPAFRALMGRSAYRELGEQFEDKEHELFGVHGFEQIVAELTKLEQALGIADLASFTPA